MSIALVTKFSQNVERYADPAAQILSYQYTIFYKIVNSYFRYKKEAPFVQFMAWN